MFLSGLLNAIDHWGFMYWEVFFFSWIKTQDILHYVTVSNYKMPTTCGCKTRPNHHPYTTMLASLYEAFMLKCLVWFLPDMVLCIMAKHLLWYWVEINIIKMKKTIGKASNLSFLHTQWQQKHPQSWGGNASMELLYL